MPCANDRAVILIVERRTSKIDQIDLRLQQNPPELGTPRCEVTAGWDVPVVRKCLVVVVE